MNQPEFNRLAEIDNIHANLQKDITNLFDKYGVNDEMVNDLLRILFRTENFVSAQQNRACDDGLDFTLPCERQRMLPYELRIDQEC